MNAFNPPGIAFAIKCTVAAIAAILVALWLDLPNPGWASLTVFLTSQQLGAASGAVLARSVYRVLGTLLGVTGALFVIPAFGGAPELLVFGVAAWVAACLYVSLLHRSPRGYVFLLAAYTLPLVGMPLANNNASLFDTLILRAEEIGLGAAFSIGVHTLFAPSSIKPFLVAKAQGAINDAQNWILKGLGQRPAAEAERRARARLAADLAEMRNLAAHLRFEPSITRQDMATVLALEERMVALLPLLAGVEERLAEIRATRDQLLVPGMKARLAELREAWRDCQLLLGQLTGGVAVPDARVSKLIAEAGSRTLHVDHGLAAYSGFAAALAVSVAGGLCWVLGWDQGAGTVGFAAAGSALFAFLDDPRPVLRTLLMWTLVAVPVAALYVFAIFPALDGYLELAVVMAPLFFITGLYLATPNLSLAAVSFALLSNSLISVQPVQSGDFTAFTGMAIACVFGTVIALVVISLIRVISLETGVRRLLRAAWRDLAAMAHGKQSYSRVAWASRMLDRVGMLLPRLAGASGAMRSRAGQALDDLRLGVNMIELRNAGRSAGPELRATIETALRHIGDHFQQRIRRPDARPGEVVREAIDQAIAGLAELDHGSRRVEGLTAATGLRLGLFPARATAQDRPK